MAYAAPASLLALDLAIRETVTTTFSRSIGFGVNRSLRSFENIVNNGNNWGEAAALLGTASANALAPLPRPSFAGDRALEKMRGGGAPSGARVVLVAIRIRLAKGESETAQRLSARPPRDLWREGSCFRGRGGRIWPEHDGFPCRSPVPRPAAKRQAPVVEPDGHPRPPGPCVRSKGADPHPAPLQDASRSAPHEQDSRDDKRGFGSGDNCPSQFFGGARRKGYNALIVGDFS